jgi:hypothetical protein
MLNGNDANSNTLQTYEVQPFNTASRVLPDTAPKHLHKSNNGITVHFLTS